MIIKYCHLHHFVFLQSAKWLSYSTVQPNEMQIYFIFNNNNAKWLLLWTVERGCRKELINVPQALDPKQLLHCPIYHTPSSICPWAIWFHTHSYRSRTLPLAAWFHSRQLKAAGQYSKWRTEKNHCILFCGSLYLSTDHKMCNNISKIR